MKPTGPASLRPSPPWSREADDRATPREVGEPPAAAPAAAFVISLVIGAILATAMVAVVSLTGDNERAETAVYVAGFAIMLPLSLLAAWRLATDLRGTGTLSVLAAAGAVGVTAMLAAARLVALSGTSGTPLALLELGGALGLTALLYLLVRLARAGRVGSLPGARLAAEPAVVASGALVLSVALVLLFAPGDVTAPRFVLAAILAGGVAAGYRQLRPSILPRRGGLALDVGAAALIVLVAVDLTGFSFPGRELSSSPIIPGSQLFELVQIHQDFYLGPVNDVLHGRALLVDSGAVYGVGSIYSLAAWFKVAPLGYGALGLLGGLVTAAQYVLALLILRLGGCRRLLAAATLAAAVAATILAPLGSSSFFLNVGGLRFGLPYVLVLAALLAARRPRANPATSPGVLATIAFVALWSAETFVYTAAALLAVAAFDAAIRTASLRAGARRLLGNLGWALAGCLGAHLLFALGTLALAGGWPEWSWYIAYVREWVEAYEKQFVTAWTPGWLLGGLYFASFAGVATVVAFRRRLAEVARLPLLAIAATTAVGAANLSYFVAHSADPILPFIALPALMVTALWLALALRTDLVAAPLRTAAVGLAAWVLLLSFVATWPQVKQRWPRTALAHALPGGHSFSGDLDRAWDSRPIDPRVGDAVRLIDGHFPAGERALVLVEMDLGTEALMRSGRVNVLPISHPWQEQVAPQYSTPRIAEAIAGLRPGTPMLLQRRPQGQGGLTLRVLQSFGAIAVGQRLGPQQLDALRMIRDRFDLEPVVRGPDGLVVMRLVRPAGA